MPYTPGNPPSVKDEDMRSFVQWVERELLAIARASVESVALELRPVFREPTKPRPGMIVYADGTMWNPSGGEGVYTYNIAGTWVKL